MEELAHKMTLDEVAYCGLRDSGATIQKASDTIGKSLSTGKRIEKRRKTLSLTTPDMVNSATRSIKKMASGKPVNGIEPTSAVVLQACKEVTDRSHPKVTQSLSISCDISPIDLEKYRRG